MLLPLTLALACGKDGGGDATQGEQGDEAGATGSTGTPGTTSGTATTTGAATTSGGTTTGTTTGTSASTGPAITSEPDPTGGDCVTGFLCTPDMGGDIASCDVFAQDCPDGEKCVAYGEGGSTSWNATRCVPVTGDGQPGDQCAAPEGGLGGFDDCGAGVFCWDVLGFTGVCVALCGGTAEAPTCGPNSVCLISNDGVLNLCLPSCDPLIQDCPGDDLCVPSGNGFFCSQDASGDEGQVNDTCQGGNVCDKGLTCSDTATASSACNPNATGCCQPYCEFPDAPCPNPDQQCLQWFNPRELPMNDPRLDIGVCGIPQ